MGRRQGLEWEEKADGQKGIEWQLEEGDLETAISINGDLSERSTGIVHGGFGHEVGISGKMKP